MLCHRAMKAAHNFEVSRAFLKCASVEQSAILTIGKDKTIPDHNPIPFSSLNSLMRDDHAQDRLAENAGRFFMRSAGELVEWRERVLSDNDGFYQTCHSGFLFVGQFRHIDKCVRIGGLPPEQIIGADIIEI